MRLWIKRQIAELLYILGKHPTFSTGIDGLITAGYGELHFYGYWQFPLSDKTILKHIGCNTWEEWAKITERRLSL